MSGAALVSIIALLGWLILASSAFRAHRIGARKMIVMGLTWAAIFLAVVFVFARLG